MLLSIIIPVYNLEKYISECLDSIVNQVEKNMQDKLEVIIIDDGSKDKSGKICNEYVKKYNFIKYYYQDNSGVSVARNNGLELSNGKYIYFIDGDDLILNNSLKQLFNILSSGKNDIICCKYVQFFSEKKINKINEKQKKENVSFIENISALELLERKLIHPALWANIFKREIFVENNIKLNENLKYTEDMECTFRFLFSSKNICVFQIPVYAYRKSRKDSATKNISEKRIEDIINFCIYWDEKYSYSELNMKLKEIMNKFTNYQYSIAIALLFSANNEIFNNKYSYVKKYKDKLLDISGAKGIFIKLIYKLFGFDFTGKILSIYLKFKK